LVIRISGINDSKVYYLEAMKESFSGSGLSLNSLTTFEGQARTRSICFPGISVGCDKSPRGSTSSNLLSVGPKATNKRRGKYSKIRKNFFKISHGEIVPCINIGVQREVEAPIVGEVFQYLF